jgi:hypothetical protein
MRPILRARWAQGLWFPDANTLLFQPVGAFETTRTVNPNAGPPGYATYNIQFNQAVRGLQFTWGGLDNGDNIEMFAFNGATVVPILASYVTLNGSDISRSTPQVDRFNCASALVTTAFGGRASDPSSNPGFGTNTDVSFVFPVGVTLDRLFVRSSKTGNTNDGNVTTQICGMAWDVDTSIRVYKTTIGGTGAFSFTGTNGRATAEVLTTTASGTAVNGAVQNVTNANTATTITEALPTGWALQSVSCTGIGTGTATPNLAAGSVALNAAALAPANQVQCSFVNRRIIDAVNDSYSGINGLVGATTATVLANDTLFGAILSAGDINLTPGTAPSPAAGSITMNANGTITVAAGTAAGTYSYPYQI